MFPTGHAFTFTTPYTIGPTGWTDEAFAARIGTAAEVIGLVSDDEYDRSEVGDMYRVRFMADGVEMTVWPEEIDPSLLLAEG